MNDTVDGGIKGLRILIVEDEHLVALALADDLEEAGAIVVGPTSSVQGALDLIAQHPIAAAVLDIKLQSQMCFPVADALTEGGVPFLFTTGFDGGVLPIEYAHIPKCEKPSPPERIIEMLADLTRGSDATGA